MSLGDIAPRLQGEILAAARAQALAPSGLPVASTGTFVLMGDSRVAQYNVSAPALQSVNGCNYFAWANALMGMPFRVVANRGVSGLRSDQFLSQNLASAIKTPSEWLHIGPPAANDIGQAAAGYTDVYGNAISVANVAKQVATNIKAACIAGVTAGKRVLISTEWGSTSWVASQCVAVFQLNEYLRNIALTIPGVFLWDGAKDYWNVTASATTIGFRSGVSGDGVHPIVLGGYDLGVSLQNWFGTQRPTIDYLASNSADVPANNSQSLMDNGLFVTQTGGSISGGATLSSGALPANWQFVGGAGTSVAVTYGANANGYGQEITLTITATAADSCTFAHNSFGGSLSLTDVVSTAIQMSVAAGSVNFAGWLETDMQSNAGNTPNFALWADRTQSLGPGPAVAYTVTLYCPYTGFPAGSTSITLAKQIIHLDFSGAGSVAVTFRRAVARKQLVA